MKEVLHRRCACWRACVRPRRAVHSHFRRMAAGRRTAIRKGGEAMGALAGAVDSYGYNGRNEVVSARRVLANSTVQGFSDDLPDCPCHIPLDPSGCPIKNGLGDKWTSPTETGHEGGSWESRSKYPISSLAGQQCVYDSAGKLINRGSGSGTPDRVNPDISLLGHILYDVVPYKWNLWKKGPKRAEEIDHATHPPNQGRDSNGNPCPPNDGSDNPKPCKNPCDN